MLRILPQNGPRAFIWGDASTNGVCAIGPHSAGLPASTASRSYQESRKQKSGYRPVYPYFSAA